MKKLLSLILCAVMLLGMMGVCASAEGEVTLVVSSATAKPGEEVEILISIENNPSISGISGEIKWDESVMTYTGFTAKTTKGVWSMDTFEEDHVILWYYDGLTNAYTGTELIVLKFQVAEDAADGEYPVTIELDPDWDAIVDEDNNTIEEFSIVGGSVTVASKDPVEDGFYLVGTLNDWTPAEAYKFGPNPSNSSEYMLETTLEVGKEIKVVKVQNNGIAGWYPDGTGNNYVVDEAHSGAVTIYFKDYYDESWSAFGGYMWINAKVTPEDAAEIYGASLSLKGNIGLNFFLTIPENILAVEGAYVDLNGEKLPVASAKTREVSGETLHQFTLELPAKEMNDVVTLRLLDADDAALKLYNNGEDLTETGFAFTIHDYIQRALETSEDENLKALMVAMSDYGSLAQKHFKYNLSNCPEILGEPEAVTLADLEAYQEVDTAGTATGLTYEGSSLVLESQTVLRFYFTLDEGKISDYTFKVAGKKVTPVEKDGKYYVEATNIHAKDLDKVYTVTVSSAAGTVITIKASGLSYAYKVLNSSDDTDLVNLVKGLYLYNRAADTYFG